MIAVRTEELRKVFGTLLALDGLSLSVEEGTVFGFLGPNGAGKTTTIRILTGLAHATSGQAWVFGKEVTANGHEIAQQIGFLPEEPAFYPWMTPGEFLDYVGRVFGLSNHRCVLPGSKSCWRWQVWKRQPNGALEGSHAACANGWHWHRHCSTTRRCCSWMNQPVHWTRSGRKEVLDFIEQLRGQCTVFMSTHILADVERVCDTVGIINRGKLVTAAPREVLLAQYAIPAFEVEVDTQSEAGFDPWSEALQRETWVKTISLEGCVARVIVSDVEAAKKELLASITQAGLILTRYEVVKPSLEDVFLQLVGQEEAEK